jgi:hypothetical protein
MGLNNANAPGIDLNYLLGDIDGIKVPKPTDS